MAQAEDDSVQTSIDSLAEAVSSLGDLTKSTPKRKADPKPKAAKDNKKKPRKAWDMVQFGGIALAPHKYMLEKIMVIVLSQGDVQDVM